MSKRKVQVGFIGVLIYCVFGFISFMAWSWFGTSRSTGEVVSPLPDTKKVGPEVVFDETLPKTEPCLLNGVLYSKKQREWWEKHRPLGVMIENHEEARPQSGLSYADVIYEAVAEGGITRFLAVFYCQDPGTVGPVRSARAYFLDFISEYADFPLYAHVGGANTPGPADALSQIEQYGWLSYNDLNQFSIGFPVFWRDYERVGHPVATEHTMYASADKLWELAKTRNLAQVDKKGNVWNKDFTWYAFKDDGVAAQRPSVQEVNFEFWKGYSQYAVRWEYKREQNMYKRYTGGESHHDRNNKKEIYAKNVVFLFMTEKNANDGYEENVHLLYGTRGTGKALIFQDGKEVSAAWSKKDRTSRTVLKDNLENEVELNRGLTWFEIVPKGTVVSAQ